MDKTKKMKYDIHIQNNSQKTISNVQSEMKGESEKVGFYNEDDVVEYIKGLRKSKKITGEITNCDYIRKNYTQCSNL